MNYPIVYFILLISFFITDFLFVFGLPTNEIHSLFPRIRDEPKTITDINAKPTEINSSNAQTFQNPNKDSFPIPTNYITDIHHVGPPDEILQSSSNTSLVKIFPAPKIIDLECLKQVAKLYWAYPILLPKNTPIHYVIYQRYDDDPQPIWKKVKFNELIRVNQLVIKSIFPNSNYSFMVQAVWNDSDANRLIQGENSTIISCKSQFDVPMRNPRIISAYYDSKHQWIDVIWEPLQSYEMGGPQFFYVITWWHEKNPEKKRTYYTEKTRFTINNIIPNINYNIQVESKNLFGLSYQKAVPFQGNQNESKPISKPDGFRVHVIDGRMVKFNWNPVPFKYINGNFHGYLLHFQHGNKQFEYLVEENITEITLNIFQPKEKYQVSIAVTNSKFSGNFTTPIEFFTFEFIKPAKPIIIETFYCKIYQMNIVEHYMDLIFQSSDVENIKYKFNICIRQLNLKVDMETYCQKKSNGFDEPEIYLPERDNLLKYRFSEDQLDSEIWVSSVAINGSMSTESDIKKMFKRKSDWNETCKTTMRFKSTTTTTTMMPATIEQTLSTAFFEDQNYDDIVTELENATIADINVINITNIKELNADNDNDQKIDSKFPYWIVSLISFLLVLIGVVAIMIAHRTNVLCFTIENPRMNRKQIGENAYEVVPTERSTETHNLNEQILNISLHNRSTNINERESTAETVNHLLAVPKKTNIDDDEDDTPYRPPQ